MKAVARGYNIVLTSTKKKVLHTILACNVQGIFTEHFRMRNEQKKLFVFMDLLPNRFVTRP